MSNKSIYIWNNTKAWCQNNPGKMAAIVTPDGMFTVTYTAKSEEPTTGMGQLTFDSEDNSLAELDWLKRRFTETER